MKCECCSKESSDVKTLTLCDDCFNRFNKITQMLLIENLVLKTFILGGVK